jgi:hypothetical protein
MRPKTWAPKLEVLEDRLTPSLTYILDAAGNLSVFGTTANAMLTFTENAGNAVTVMDGASTKMFAVTGNLTVNVKGTSPGFTLALSLAANTAGNVSLTAGSLTGVTVDVDATAVSTITGNLGIKTGSTNDFVNVNAISGTGVLTVAGNTCIDTGAGNDTVFLGGTGDVSLHGNLAAYNVNLLLFGGTNISVGGLTNVTTDNAPPFTNLVSTSPTTTLGGMFLFTGAGPTNLLLNGPVAGRVLANMGNGANNVFVLGGTATVGGNVNVIGGNGGDTATVATGSVIDGNFSMIVGNGTNNLVFDGTLLGTSISYYGGSGPDTVSYFGTAPGARFTALLGPGDDTFILSSNSLGSAFLDGGFGTNTFLSSVIINFPITLLNFS